MAKVTGIGGVFFKSTKDKTALAKWYSDHLGIEAASWGGAILNWKDDPRRDDGGQTVWTVAAADSKWFDAPFMINYRVDDLDAMVEQLREAGVEFAGEPRADDNGKFAWVIDPDGNKVELWEPKAE